MTELLLVLHVLGACVLVGTGGGIAFFTLAAHRSGDVATIAHVSRIAVAADAAVMASAAVAQPVTGMLLAIAAGWSLDSGWILAATGLVVVVGVLWLPAAGMQREMRDLAGAALTAGMPLPPRHDALFRRWATCQAAALAAILAVVGLMVAKPF